MLEHARKECLARTPSAGALHRTHVYTILYGIFPYTCTQYYMVFFPLGKSAPLYVSGFGIVGCSSKRESLVSVSTSQYSDLLTPMSGAGASHGVLLPHLAAGFGVEEVVQVESSEDMLMRDANLPEHAPAGVTVHRLAWDEEHLLLPPVR